MMEKVAVNNLVVVLRRLLKTERVFQIKKMTSEIKKLENSKGPNAEKRRQKAARWKDQVKYLKKVDLTTVARRALAAEEPWKSVLVRSDATPEERALARLVDRPRVQKEIEEFRNANTDWREWLPKIYDAWEKRREERFVVSRSEIPVTPSLNEAKEECKVRPSPDGENTAERPVKTKAVPKGARLVPTSSSKLEVKKKALLEAGEMMAKEAPDKQVPSVPDHSPDRVQKLFMKMAAEEEPDEESSPRKFAAGDPFFWPAVKTSSDDEGGNTERPSFTSSVKKRLPLPQRSFGKTGGKHRHSTAFSPAAAKSASSQAFRKAPQSTGKLPSENSDLHPSWIAKRQAQKAVVPFQGKKITFS